MGDDIKKARESWEQFVVNSDNVRVEGRYDAVNNRIFIDRGYDDLEDGGRYRFLSRCGIEVVGRVDKYQRRIKVIGVYNRRGKYLHGARVWEPDCRRTLDLICFEDERSD